MAESPEETEALAKLDEATRHVAWQEEEKEEDRELSTGWGWGWGWRGGWGWRAGPGRVGRYGRFRPFRRKKGDPVLEPVDDSDPGDEHGLRDTLRDDAKP